MITENNEDEIPMTESKKYAIGVDLGGTSIKVGLVDESGEIVSKTSVDTKANEGPDVVIEQMKRGINTLLKMNDNLIIEGIGIGAPGVVKAKTGVVENPPNLPGWGTVQLGSIIKRAFRMSVFVENDANAAAIGELIFGAGKKLDSFIMITLGTGVGGGIVINRRIYRGDTGAAGEIGHVAIDHNGRKCNCGSTGCVEAYLGNGYLVDHVVRELPKYPDSKINALIQGDYSKLTPKIIHEASLAGDTYAKAIIIECGKNLGYAITSVVNLFDISNVVIGGGVAGFGELLFTSFENTVKDRVLKSLSANFKVREAKLKTEAGILGASALVFYES